MAKKLKVTNIIELENGNLYFSTEYLAGFEVEKDKDKWMWLIGKAWLLSLLDIKSANVFLNFNDIEILAWRKLTGFLFNDNNLLGDNQL